tara:strand:+ start:91 stop:651 length:561 start_codon:yes stop_codon:yes gene_type:complete
MDDLKVLSQNEVNELYELFNYLVSMLDKYAIPYACAGGTLLGTIRSEGLIQWDDDIDITIERCHIPTFLWLKSIMTDGGKYELVKVGKYMKLKYNNIFIDIFIIDDGIYPQKTWSEYNFKEDEYYPLQDAMFGYIKVKVPNKYNDYLNRTFPDWMNTAHIYNHKTKDKKKISLTDELRQPYLNLTL